MIKITYCKDGTNNWGDYIAPVLVEYITGQKTQYIKSEGFVEDEDVYAIVGSILSWQQKPNLNVWGPGFMCEGQSMLIKPKKVFAVRVPMTRKLLLNQGIDCPEIYGDPALLFPKFYNPVIEKKYKIGVIPLFESLEYIRLNNIEGDFVECGVWKGGNILGMMEYLSYHNMIDRKVWIYDTFEGMTNPEDEVTNDVKENWKKLKAPDYIINNLIIFNKK